MTGGSIPPHRPGPDELGPLPTSAVPAPRNVERARRKCEQRGHEWTMHAVRTLAEPGDRPVAIGCGRGCGHPGFDLVDRSRPPLPDDDHEAWQALREGVPLGHSVSAHTLLGWCSLCSGRTTAEEACAWQAWAYLRLCDDPRFGRDV